MLKALKKVPPVLNLTLKDFTIPRHPRVPVRRGGFDLGVVKNGQGYTEMMAFNTVATAALDAVARWAAADARARSMPT